LKAFPKAKNMTDGECGDMAKKMAQAYIQKYDKAGNGQLSQEESNEMLEEIVKMMIEEALEKYPADLLSMMGGKEAARK